MAKFQAGDLVHVKALPGRTDEGSGIVKASSKGEEGTEYLVEFEEGEKAWYNENLIELLQRDKPFQPTKAPRQSSWSKNPQLAESILDAWYELSPETFNQAYETLEGFGATMIDWLKETNPELYKSSYVKGHELIGIKIYYVKG